MGEIGLGSRIERTSGQWLDKAHEPTLLEDAKKKAEQLGFLSYPSRGRTESLYLQGFSKGNRRVIDAYATTVKPSSVVTLDMDAHHKLVVPRLTD